MQGNASCVPSCVPEDAQSEPPFWSQFQRIQAVATVLEEDVSRLKSRLSLWLRVEVKGEEPDGKELCEPLVSEGLASLEELHAKLDNIHRQTKDMLSRLVL